MADRSDLKAELERKKQRLAQIREEKKRKEEERKKKESEMLQRAENVSEDSDLDRKRRETEALLQSIGISPEPPLVPTPMSPSSQSVSPPSETGSQESIDGGTIDFMPKELVTYCKETQTPVASDQPEVYPRELTNEEKEQIVHSEDFLFFFDRSIRVMERVLAEDTDIFFDYSGRDMEDKEGDMQAGSNLCFNRHFYDEHWSKHRVYPELLVASYNTNEDAPHEPDGVVLVWNMKFKKMTPEYIFHCQSSVMSVGFAQFHPNLVIGGTYSGQIALWDNRSHRRTPVQRTPLSATAHTHPVYCVNVVGTQNANNLITVSTDGKMCSWSLDMLSQPQESMELIYNKSKPVAVTCMAFPASDVNNYVVGSEEGTVYTASRHGSKAGIGEMFDGHQGPVTGISCHNAVGPVDFSHLFTTSSFDWTVKLWSTKHNKPLYSFEDNADYVYDIMWSPVHPALFATVDGNGRLDLWNLNNYTEVPSASVTVEGGCALNRVRWASGGREVAVGDSEGQVWIYDVGEFAVPHTDDWSKFARTLMEIRANRGDGEEEDGSSVFMCKICNLFSPSKPLLLSHVNETHSNEGGDPDTFIIALKPLTTQEPQSSEVVVKRKRGRPKGSTKKVQPEKVQKKPNQEKESTEIQPLTVAEEPSEDGSDLECKKCNRVFSNRRQISKHICFVGLKEAADEEEYNGNNTDANKISDGEEEKERTPKKARAMRTDKLSSAKDPESASGNKNPIISVVLTSHEAMPGASKIVPIEAAPAEPSTQTVADADVKNLLKHIRETHDMNDKKVQDSYNEYSLQTREGKRQLLYNCQICDRKFKNELERDRHMMVHGNKRPFGCELCDHGSTKYQALQAHIRKHPFIYVCAICQEKFVSSVRLRSHLREFHPESDEPSAFADSINSSFCLLKPGDDIQKDMLNQDELKITEELSQLNAQELLTTEITCMAQEELQTQCSDNLVVDSDLLVQNSQDENPVSDTSAVAQTQEDVINAQRLPDDQIKIECSMTEDQIHAQETAPLTSEKAQTHSEHLVSKDTFPQTEEEAIAPQTIADEDLLSSEEEEISAFKRIVHYNTHVRTHTKEHLHYCSQCNYSSITKNCLKRHVIQRHSDILLKCPSDGCQYCTPDKYKLQAHLKTHSDIVKKSFICPVCQESVPEDKVRAHIKSNHPDVSLNYISETLGIRVHVKGVIGKRASKCPYCDCFFTRNGADLQQHIWAHEGLKPYKCSQCDYASRSKSNLKAHMNRHSTEKTHLCDLCGKKFKSKCTLKSHKLMHTADGGFLTLFLQLHVVLFGLMYLKQQDLHNLTYFQVTLDRVIKLGCTECDFTAALRPHLLRHMEQHASFKVTPKASIFILCCHVSYSHHQSTMFCLSQPFRCAQCHYSCNISGGVKCPVCNYVYGTKWEMNRHLKSKHGLKVVETDSLGLNQWEVVESVEEPAMQYLHIAETEDPQGTETAVSALQDLRFNTQNGVVSAAAGDRLDQASVNILQQIIELGSETHDATVASVVEEEEPQANHAMMIQDALQQATVGLGEEHHLVVSSDDMEGIKTVTVYTQGEDASQFIVYVQEAVQEAVQTEETTTV
ncbi:Cytoplasmic dynein 1 intermediate chain 1 [Labeo rohita]|uniref:Cytoplasmic dynein 1 intermediate chain 1 n=2 Tax=Labeonini TaxID=2743697 RepID=A0ABQ8LZ68_LABRO|nr:Cytoplasmic dynein 1 intermediate chain 1 [Labeo rohita]